VSLLDKSFQAKLNQDSFKEQKGSGTDSKFKPLEQQRDRHNAKAVQCGSIWQTFACSSA
jgi:hypothetical protein